MNSSNRHLGNLDRLERHRERMNARLEAQRERVNKRFDREREKLNKNLTVRQQEIIDAALKLLDAEGLESVTLRGLAKHLDMKAPAIYWHFKSKVSLIDFLAEAILQEEFPKMPLRPADEPWQEWIAMMMHRLRHAMLAHKDGGRIVAGAHLYPAESLAKFVEALMESLVSAGMTIRQADLMTSTLIHFTFGRVIEEQSAPKPEDFENEDIMQFLGRYPYLARSVKEAQEGEGLSDETEFADSLQLIIRGYGAIE